MGITFKIEFWKKEKNQSEESAYKRNRKEEGFFSNSKKQLIPQSRTYCTQNTLNA